MQLKKNKGKKYLPCSLNIKVTSATITCDSLY